MRTDSHKNSHPGTWERWAWCLNDMANSAFALIMVTAIFPIYFTDVLVGDEAEGIALWGLTISLSMAFVAISSPLMGALADRRAWRKRLLAVYTLVGVCATAACALLDPGMWVLAMIVVGFANLGFEGSVVFYDALLPGLTTPERMGRWSGFGWGTGYLGSMVCLLLCLPIATEGDIRHVFLLVAVWWAVFSLPLFVKVKERTPARLEAGGAFAELCTSLGRIKRNKDLRRFFLGFFLYTNGISTTVAFAALFAKGELGFDMASTIKLLLLVQLAGAVGAFGLGVVADRIGHVRTIVGTLVVWCVLILAAYFVETQGDFWWIAGGIGLVMGATQSCSRGFLAAVVSEERAGEYFGFKAVAGKGSAVIGPALFGWVTFVTGSQRPAILAIGVLFVAGLVLMLGVNEARARETERSGS